MMNDVPSILLDYQIRWMMDKSQIRLWEKSRRIGASWVCAAEAVIEAAKAQGGYDTTYTSYNKENTREFIDDCASWVNVIRGAAAEMEEHRELDQKTGEEILTYMIRFPSGNKILTVSSKPDNLRNRKGRIIIDEAAFGPDLFMAIKAGLGIKMWGGRMDILSTHNGVDSPFNKYIQNIKEGRARGSIYRTTIDDAIADGLYKRICLVRGIKWDPDEEQAWLDDLIMSWGEFADEELRCIPRRSGGTYLSRMIIEDCMINVPVLRFDAPDGFAGRTDEQRQKYMTDWLKRFVAPVLARLPKNLEHCFGEDFGRTADITAIVPCTVTQDLKRRVPFILELRNTPFREQELALFFVVDRLPRFSYGALDAVGNGQYLAERAWQRYGGSMIEQVHITSQWYAENLPPLKAAFEDDQIEVPRDADVLNDLLSFRVIQGIPKLPDIRKPSVAAGVRSRAPTRHGDAAIGITLAHYSTRQPKAACEGYNTAESRTPSPTAKGWGGFRSSKGGIL
jgi:phage FluMu gp28-like protein